MLASGALGMAGLTAQAHGNASSHASLSLDWNFDDFVINREKLLNPDGADSDPLLQLDQELREVYEHSAKLRQESEVPGASVSDRLESVTESRLLDERAMGLELDIKQAATQRALTPLSRNVLAQFQANNPAGATALIERSGTPRDVLSSYATVQLDFYNFSAVGGRSTTTLTDQIITLSDAAIAYQERNAPNDLVALGGFLHNLASAALPDIGQATPEQFRIGREAAQRAVDVRRRTNDPVTTGIALYLAGVYSFKASEFDDAEKKLRESIALLENTDRTNDLGWSTAYLGFVRSAQGLEDGTLMVEQARRIFQRSGNDYALQYISTYQR
jgi:hypothetical protein